MCLGRPDDFGRDACFGQFFLKLVFCLGDPFLPIVALLFNGTCQLAIGIGFQVAEAEILQLPFDLPDAEPVSERRKNVQCLAGDALLFVLLLAAERTHVVQAVSQLDDYDAHVVDHGEKHLAQGFGLGVGDTVLVRC